MYPSKKPALKTNWPFFLLGMLTFIMIPLIGIILTTGYPLVYKIISEAVLIGLYLAVIFGVTEEHQDVLFSNKAISFMSGLGLCFLLTIILFFGAMIWGVSQT